jgi:hypothetical protein
MGLLDALAWSSARVIHALMLSRRAEEVLQVERCILQTTKITRDKDFDA